MKSLYFYKKSYIYPKYISSLSQFFNLHSVLKNKAGRNNSGHICVHHKGGGHKKNYRLLDFKNINKKKRLISIEYDPNRSAFIGLFYNYSNNQLFFDLYCDGQSVGSLYKSSENSEDIALGNTVSLANIPLGTLINSLTLKKGKGFQYLRSAGSFGKLQKKDLKLFLARIKMPSKKDIFLSLNCTAKIGIVSNISHKNKNIAKAGRNR
jgi:large subunit ribosomal protein L2